MSATPPLHYDGRAAWSTPDNAPHIGMDEDRGPFVPCIIQPEQFADMHRGANDSPEKRLWMAVMEDARNCLSGDPGCLHTCKNSEDKRRHRLVWEALHWIEDRRDGLGGFTFVCCVLDLDPDATRETLLRRYANGDLKHQRKSPVMSKPPALGCNPDRRRNRKREQGRWRNRKTRSVS